MGHAAALPACPERAATRSEELAALVNHRPGKLFKLFTALGFALHALTVAGLQAAPRGVRGLAFSAIKFANHAGVRRFTLAAGTGAATTIAVVTPAPVPTPTSTKAAIVVAAVLLLGAVAAAESGVVAGVVVVLAAGVGTGAGIWGPGVIVLSGVIVLWVPILAVTWVRLIRPAKRVRGMPPSR